MGADLQFSYDIVGLGGLILRGEAAWGDWVTNSGDNKVYVGAGNPYLRPFLGYYLTLVQNIGTHLQAVVRYDAFDPNTEVSDNEVSTQKKLSAADIATATFGGGLNYFFNENVRLSVYYDHPINETTTNVSGYAKDKKDDVITARIQFKF